MGGSISFLQEMLDIKCIDEDNLDEIICFTQLVLISEGIWMDADSLKTICMRFSTNQEIQLDDDDDGFCMHFIELQCKKENSIWNYQFENISDLEYLNHLSWYTDLQSCFDTHKQEEEPLIDIDSDTDELYLVSPLLTLNYLTTIEEELLDKMTRYMEVYSKDYLRKQFGTNGLSYNTVTDRNLDKEQSEWMKMGMKTIDLFQDYRHMKTKEFQMDLFPMIQMMCYLDMEKFKSTGSYTDKGRARRSRQYVFYILNTIYEIRSRKYFDVELSDQDYETLSFNLLIK